MSHSLVRLNIHCIFSTFKKEPWISIELEKELYLYMIGIAEKRMSKVLAINGIHNHIHILLSLDPSLALADRIHNLKGSSSFWIKRNFPNMEHFSWQEGYSAFSVSISHLGKTVDYIANQKIHHQTVSFEEELRLILNRHGIDEATQ